MQASRSLSPISVAVPLCLGIAVGFAVAAVPTELTLVAVLAGLGFLFFLAMRAAVMSGASSRGGTAPDRPAPSTAVDLAVPESAQHAESHLRLASRAAYLIGIALMGVQLLRPAFGFTVSDLFFVLATIGTAILVVRERTILSTIYPPLLLVGAGLFALGTVVSTIGSPMPGDSIAQLVKFLFIIFGWFAATVILIDRPQHVVMATIAWVGTVAINGIAALVQFGFGDVIPGATAAWGRMAGLTDHFNDLGGSAGLALPAAIMLAVAARGGLAVLAWGGVGLVMSGLLLSGSVGGGVAAIVGCLTVLATGRIHISRRAALSLVGVLAVLIVGTLALTSMGVQTPLARIDVAAGAGGTFASRVQTYEQALWSIGLDPILGTGLSQGPTRTGYDVHSLLLGAWYQTGIVGVACLFTVVVAGSAVAIVAARRFDIPPFSLVVAGLVGSYCGFLVLGLAQPLLIQRYAWVPLALLLALAARIRYRDRRVDRGDSVVGNPAA
jgi:hypothetical protein